MMLPFLLLPLMVVAPPPAQLGNGCLPPPQPYPNNCGPFNSNPNYSCNEAIFNLTSGRWFGCYSHTDCYNHREPNEWCYRPPGYQWAERGCFCDEKIGSCIVERQGPSNDQFEWAYCVTDAEFVCNTSTGVCY